MERTFFFFLLFHLFWALFLVAELTDSNNEYILHKTETDQPAFWYIKKDIEVVWIFHCIPSASTFSYVNKPNPQQKKVMNLFNYIDKPCNLSANNIARREEAILFVLQNTVSDRFSLGTTKTIFVYIALIQISVLLFMLFVYLL